MSKQKILQAKQLMIEKRYDEARAILETVDHPRVEEWLAKLPPQKTKNKTAQSNKFKFVGIGILSLVILFLTFGGGVLVGREMMRSEIESAMREFFYGDATNDPSIDATKTAIYNANSTVEVLIQATQTAAAQPVNATPTILNDINLTRTAIHNANSTTEVLIYATKTAAAINIKLSQTATALPTWTPTPE